MNRHLESGGEDYEEEDEEEEAAEEEEAVEEEEEAAAEYDNGTSTSSSLIFQHLDLLEPLCFQPPHLDLPSRNQPYATIIDAFRAVFLVDQNDKDDPIFARATYKTADSDGELVDESITVLRSQLKKALDFASSDKVLWDAAHYGVVVVGMLAPNEVDMTIHVLCLDEWKHVASSDGGYQTAIAQTAVDHPCGSLDAKLWSERVKELTEFLKKKSDVPKSAPLVIRAVRRIVLKQEVHEVKGYTSDVTDRNTVMPLLMGLLKLYLNSVCHPHAPAVSPLSGSCVMPAVETAMATKFLSIMSQYKPNTSIHPLAPRTQLEKHLALAKALLNIIINNDDEGIQHLYDVAPSALFKKADKQSSKLRSISSLAKIVEECADILLNDLRGHFCLETGLPWTIPAAKGDEKQFLMDQVWSILMVGCSQLKGPNPLPHAIEVVRKARYLLVWHVAGTTGCQDDEKAILGDAFKSSHTLCATGSKCKDIGGCTEGFPHEKSTTSGAHMMSAAGTLLLTTCVKSNNNEKAIGVVTLTDPNLFAYYFKKRGWRSQKNRSWYKSVLSMIQVVVAKSLALKDRGGLVLDCGSSSLLNIAENARTVINHHRDDVLDDLMKSTDLNIRKGHSILMGEMGIRNLTATFDVNRVEITEGAVHTALEYDSCPYLLPENFEAAFKWLEYIQLHLRKEDDIYSDVDMPHLFLGVKSIEGLIYNLAKTYIPNLQSAPINGSTVDFSLNFLANLQKLLLLYEDVATRLRNFTAVHSCTTLLHSRMVLCVLVAACIADVVLVATIPEAEEYGFLLSATCVETLSLDTADARGAALAVAKYAASRHSKSPLFGDGTTFPIGPTHGFAGRVAKSDHEARLRVKCQTEKMKEDLKKHEEAFKSQKQKYVEAENKRDRRSRVVPEHWDYPLEYDRFGTLRPQKRKSKEKRDWEDDMVLLTAEADRENISMSPLIFDIPSEEFEKYIFAFYANPHAVVQATSALIAEAISALQVFLTGNCKTIEPKGMECSISSSTHSKGISMFLPKPAEILPSKISDLKSFTDDVHYPKVSQLTQFISARGAVYISMAQPPVIAISEGFTDQTLPPSHTLFQWLVNIDRDGTNGSTRGNEVYANVHQRPNEFTQQQFNLLGEVRAFPSMQLRSVCLALDSFDALPLDHPVVDVVLRQAMYQMGPFQEAEPWPWHAELLTEGGQDLLHTALSNVIARVRKSQLLYKSVPLIISLTHFLASFDSKRGADLSNEVGEICSRWADERKHDDSRVLIAQYWYFAARAFAHGFEPHTLHANYTAAIVAAHHAWVWDSNHKDYKDVVSAAASTYAASTSSVINSIRRACKHVGTESVLTGAVRKVKTVGMPENLAWYVITDNPTAYVATDDTTKDQYMVNIHTGLVLINGLPLETLPESILSHPLFASTFINVDIDSGKTDESWMGSVVYNATVHDPSTKNSRLYKIAISGEKLLVVELPEESTNHSLKNQNGRILFLQPQSTADHLPTRLSAKYSHWAEIDTAGEFTGLVYLRGVHIEDRKVYYFIPEDDIYWVPPSRRDNFDPDGDVTLLEQLVEGTEGSVVEQVVSSLQHFEPDYDFIECRRAEKDSVSVILTRYSLEFDIDHVGVVQPRLWRGMRFATRQQLPHQLPNFTRYFVLEDRSDSSVCRIIVPQWCLAQNSECPTDLDAQLKYASYSLHPTLQLLEATTLRDRLQLACIQVSSCNGLPQEPFLSSSLTGVEAAMINLKACYPNRPFSVSEAEMVEVITHHGRWHPSIVLRCALLWRTSEELVPLHEITEPTENEIKENAKLKNISDYFARIVPSYCVTYKRLLERPWPTNLPSRLQLSATEEKALFGTTVAYSCNMSSSSTFQELKNISRRGKCSSRMGDMNVADTNRTMEHIEAQLKTLFDICELYLLSKGDIRYKTSDVYPLEGLPQSGIGEELKASWDGHERNCDEKTEHLNKNLSSTSINDLLSDIMGNSLKLKEKTASIITKLRAACEHQTIFGKMSELGHVEPTPTIAELLRAPLDTNAWCPEAIDAMLCWMTATVLSDKLSRLWIAISGSSSPVLMLNLDEEKADAIVHELSSQRVWEVKDYPSWLIFEVVNRLQSRPEQARVAMRMCKEGANGDITQLNMGMGKTRIIIPFLVLHSVFKTSTGGLPRMLIPPELEAEFTGYAFKYLGASPVCPIHIVSLPFNRSLELGPRPLERLCKLLTKSHHIAVVTNPTAWLSMKLHLEELTLRQDKEDFNAKYDEENTKSAISQMEKLLGIKRFDILDEADALLHHRFRLTYSHGQQPYLKDFDGPERWNTLFGLLRLVKTSTTMPTANELYKMAQDDVRFAESSHIPFTPDERILDRKADIQGMSPVALAMRCWLGFGILQNAYSMKYRVQYGLRVDARKEGVAEKDREMFAVPYRACDTPAPKAQFAHPDMILALTTLTYLERGLDRTEIQQALSALNKKGEAYQRKMYETWCSSVKLSKEYAKIKGKLDSIENYSTLDPSRASQVTACFETFRRAPPTIFFWLGEVVFPQLKVCSEQLMKTAFDVPPSSQEVGSRAVGFSGTKEAHSLLPTQVQLIDIDGAPELQATDGCMLDLVFNNVSKCVPLVGFKEDNNSWEVVLDTAMKEKVNAIIDRGGLLVGVKPRAAANYLFAAGITHVTFFEDGWRIADSHGRELSKAESPVPEADTVVIYDEARTRGSDMKLKRDAVALLTIDSRTTKDDFMQAVGRLRQFARRQKVIVAYSPSLELPDGPTDIARVLRFVVNNSVKSIDSGVTPWCDSAVRHGAVLGRAPNSLESCPLRLDKLYAAPCVPETPHERLLYRVNELQMPCEDKSKSFFEGISKRVKGMTTCVDEGGDTGLEVELERQQEHEEEREDQKKDDRTYIPAKENPWDWKLVRSSDFVCVLGSLKGTPGELKVLKNSYSKSEVDLGIDSSCTHNFRHVLSPSQLDAPLRRLSAFLWFPEHHEYILLTHYECSNILPLMLSRVTTNSTPTEVHLCFLGADATRPHWSIPLLTDSSPNMDAFKHALVSLLLEDGRTKFYPDALQEDVELLKKLGKAVAISAPTSEGDNTLRDFAREVVSARGREYTHTSQLDKALRKHK